MLQCVACCSVWHAAAAVVKCRGRRAAGDLWLGDWHPHWRSRRSRRRRMRRRRGSRRMRRSSRSSSWMFRSVQT